MASPRRSSSSPPTSIRVRRSASPTCRKGFLTTLSFYAAANWVALGILYNTGQDCTAGSRLFVQETIYDKFIDVCAFH